MSPEKENEPEEAKARKPDARKKEPEKAQKHKQRSKSKDDEKGDGKGSDSAGKAGKDEDVEIIEEKKGEYAPNQKPKLSEGETAKLKLRKQISRKRPLFRRQEGHRYKRLETGWRQSRGSHSKMRRHYKYRGRVVSIGYGSPADVRNLHPSGFEEVLVRNPMELGFIDPDVQAARIAGGVGIKKRFYIEKKADELGIRVLNWKGAELKKKT